MNKIQTYFKDSYKELTEKVTWPNWQQLQQSTMIVLVATIIITAYLTSSTIKQTNESITSASYKWRSR
jgi:preprotein translocase SecE subunit